MEKVVENGVAATATIELLRRLVAVDSTSSRPNAPVMDVIEEELARADFVSRRLKWRDAAGVEKQNLIARRGPDIPGGLALVGHSDCVPFDPEWKEALAGEVHGDKLFGRGSADNKAFLAAAVRAAAQTAGHARPLYVIATADEEVGCLGARRLAELGSVRPAQAIIGEPTRLIPVRAHKGYGLAEIDVTGLAAHSAFPELGASAVLAAGWLLRDLEEIQQQLANEKDARFSPPHTTLNVGIIRGGQAKNIIPESCHLTLEWRPIPGQDARLVLRLIEECCAVVSKGPIKAVVRPTRLDPGASVPPDAVLVRFLESETGRAAGTIPFGTELPYLVALGADTCVFGPGDIRDAHKTGEFVPLPEVAAAERVLIHAIHQFCA